MNILKKLTPMLTIFLLFACEMEEIEKKDDASNSECLPTEINYDNNSFTRKFIYNSKNQIVREDVIDNKSYVGYNAFEYNGDKLIKQTSFDSQSKQRSSSTYEYNSLNQLVSEKFFPSNNITFTESFTYEYNSLAELKKSSYFENNILVSFRTYQYSNGLMTKVIGFRANGNKNEEIEIEYDNNKSVLASLNPMIALFEPIAFPYQYNIVKYTVKNENGQIINSESYVNTYESNSQGYPVKKTIVRRDGGKVFELYTYNCIE